MTTLVDTGVLVALLYRPEKVHPWAVNLFEQARSPFVTCESVLTEAAHLVARKGVPQTGLRGWSYPVPSG